jgi:hypothetical protein
VESTFGTEVMEWFERKIARKESGNKESCTSIILCLESEGYSFPFQGDRPVADNEAPELLEALKKIESGGAAETAQRCLQYSGQIFRRAISAEMVFHGIKADLKGGKSPASTPIFPP